MSTNMDTDLESSGEGLEECLLNAVDGDEPLRSLLTGA